MGQVNVTLIGQHYLNEGGSITLTSGSLSHQPTFGGINFSTVNAAVNGFVLGAALELKQDRRINVVSPAVLTESWNGYSAAFPNYNRSKPSGDIMNIVDERTCAFL